MSERQSRLSLPTDLEQLINNELAQSFAGYMITIDNGTILWSKEDTFYGQFSFNMQRPLKLTQNYID